jgi:hypothetical protein
MYATFATITVNPGMWAFMSKGTDQMYAAIKNSKGFKEAKFFGDDKLGIYNSLVIWDSKADAEAAQAALKGKTEQALASVLKTPIIRAAYEVYEPRP